MGQEPQSIWRKLRESTPIWGALGIAVGLVAIVIPADFRWVALLTAWPFFTMAAFAVASHVERPSVARAVRWSGTAGSAVVLFLVYLWLLVPAEKISTALTWISPLIASPWFQWMGGIVVGFAGGVWLGALMWRRQGAASTDGLASKDGTQPSAIVPPGRRPCISVAEFLEADMLESVATTARLLAPDRNTAKTALIADLRSIVADAVKHQMGDAQFRTFLGVQPLYYQLRPHLSKGFLDYMANGRLASTRGPDGMTMLPRLLLDELDRYERETVAKGPPTIGSKPTHLSGKS